MIVFFDDEAEYIGNYARETEEDGWECRLTPTIEELLDCLAELEGRAPEIYDVPNVIVVDIMMPTSTGIAKGIESRLNVGIQVIESYLMEKFRAKQLSIIVLTNKNPGLVKASLNEIGLSEHEVPVWAKNEVCASLFPKRLEEFLKNH